MTVLPFEHADEAAAALREIAAEQGPSVLSDPLMLGSLLADLLPADPGAVRILVAAAEDHVADTISDNITQGLSPDAAVRLAATSFAKSSLSAPAVSQWVATSFAAATGVTVSPSAPTAPAGTPGGSGSPGGPTTPSWPLPGQSAPTMQPGVSPGPPAPPVGYQSGPPPRVSPGYGPGVSPGVNPGYGQGVSPGYGQGVSPGASPGYGQGVSPGYGQGVGPAVSPGAGPGFQPGPPGVQSGGPQTAPPIPPPYGYQPYQPQGQRSPAQNPQFAPQPVQNAVKLMYGGIALSALLAIIDFSEIGTLTSYTYLTSQQGAEFGVSVIGAIMSMLGIGLWILLAWANKRGMNWARIVGAILLGVFVLFTLVSFAGLNPLALVVELGTIAVGVITLTLIWRRESTPYYQLNSQPPAR